MDKGVIDVVAGEFHNILTNIGFECTSPYMKAFENQLLSVQETEQAIKEITT